MKQAVFIADGQYSDYAAFMRAAAVALESIGSSGYWSPDKPKEIKFTALGNKSLYNMIIEYADKTKHYLKEHGIILRDSLDEFSPFELTDDVVYVAVMNRPRFFPYKQYVAQAQARGIEIWSYNGA